MVSRLEAMQELARRGKLPPDLKPYYDELVKRGLAGGVAAPEPVDPEAVQGVISEVGIRTAPFVGPIAGAAMDMMKDGSESAGHQALSGVNEGVANFLSLPATIGNAALSIGPAISNAALGTNYETALERQARGHSPIPDPGQTARSLMADTGAIQPESKNPGLQITRRIGEEVGSALVPGAGLVAKGGKALRALTASTVGSGTGAAVAEQVAPGNAVAELAGQFAGGITPLGIAGSARRTATKQAAPELDELQAAKSAAYQKVDQLGVRYTPQSYQRLTGNIDTAVRTGGNNLSPTRHKAVHDFIEEIKARYKGGMSLTELDQLRQEVGIDLLGSTDGATRHFGRIIKDEIDDFIATATARDVANGSAPEAAAAITAARELNTRFRKTEMIDDAIIRAERRAASTGSGGNINNAIRQNLRAILDSPKKRRAFTAEELAEMEGVVRQGRGEDLLRLVGKLSPNGNGLMTALNVGAVVHNPLMALGTVAATGAKALADSGTVRKTQTLRALIARGNPVDQPIFDAPAKNALGALSVGQAANQNEKPINALRATALN